MLRMLLLDMAFDVIAAFILVMLAVGTIDHLVNVRHFRNNIYNEIL